MTFSIIVETGKKVQENNLFFTLKVSKSLKEFSEISLSKVTIRLMEKNYLCAEGGGVL